MATLPTWPSDLPHEPLLGSWQMEALNLPPLSTDMEGGNTRQRRRPGSNVATINQTLRMTRAQLTSFKTFIDETLHDGVSRFRVNVWLGDACVEKECQFAAQPAIVAVSGKVFHVSMQLRVYDPKVSIEDIVAPPPPPVSFINNMAGYARFPGQGAAGPIANSVWFGTVPDRLNMLSPYHRGTPGNTLYRDSQDVADLVEQWTILNPLHEGGANTPTLTLSGTATTPDGFASGRKLLEAATTSEHGLSAGVNANLPRGVKRRLSVFARAGERTRIVLGLMDVKRTDGAKAVFDLAGGQVAVALTAFGTGGSSGIPWQAAEPAEIVHFGNGWYRCTITVKIGGNDSGAAGASPLAFLLIDAGSGANAENSNYAGNTSRGIYVWRSTMMPPGAWGINNRIFFDDFNDPTRANFDLTNSKVNGFDWYINNSWPNPNFTGIAVMPIADLVVSGSELTIVKSPAVPLNLMTAATDGASGYVGHGWQPPFLMEAKMRWNYNVAPPASTASFWTTSLERLVGNDINPNIEVDIMESDLGSIPNTPGTNLHWSGGASIVAVNAMVGYNQWNANRTYQATRRVMHLGVIYQSLAGSNTGNVPASSPAFWGVVSPLAEEPPAAETLENDWNALHTWSVLYLPWTRDDAGQLLFFFDGRFYADLLTSPDPNFPGNPDGRVSGLHVADGHYFPVMLSAGTNYSASFDQISVTGN